LPLVLNSMVEVEQSTNENAAKTKAGGLLLSPSLQFVVGIIFFLGLLPIYLGLPAWLSKVLDNALLAPALDSMQAYPILLLLLAAAQAYVLLEVYMKRAFWWLALVPPTVCIAVFPLLGKQKLVKDLVRLTTPKFTEAPAADTTSPAATVLLTDFYTRSPSHASEKGILIRTLPVSNLDTEVAPNLHVKAAWLEKRRKITADGYLDYRIEVVPQQALLAVAFTPEMPETLRQQLANKWGNRYYHYVPETGVMYWIPRWQEAIDTSLNALLLRSSARSKSAHVDLVRSRALTPTLGKTFWMKTGERAELPDGKTHFMLQRVYEIYNDRTKETWQMAAFYVSLGTEDPTLLSICIDKACERRLLVGKKIQLRITAAVDNDLNMVLESVV